MAQPIRLPNAQEQVVLDQLVVRLITPEERPRWNELVSTHHYLKNATLVGEHLCYVAEYQGTWLALLGWAAPARHLRPRDAWVGWSKDQLACRRHFLANNARFCILADPHQLPNLASRRLASLADKLPLNQPDPRSTRGRWHPWPAVLNLICLAKLCGIMMGQRQIAEFARALTHPQRRALGCRRDPDNPRHYEVPAESTFQRALVEIDHTTLEPLLLQWQDQFLGPDT